MTNEVGFSIVQSRLGRIEPLVPLGLATHGMLLLFYLGGNFWQWLALGAVALLGLVGMFGRRGSFPFLLLRLGFLLIVTWSLMATTGGISSFFLLWYFVILPVYALLLSPGYGLLLTIVVPVSYLSLLIVPSPPLPPVVIIGRVFLLAFIGWLVQSARSILKHYITEHKGVETALQESEERLRLLTDSLPICVVYIDAQRRYQFYNKTYEMWFGRPQSGLLGKKMNEVLDEWARAAAQEKIDAALTGRTVTFEMRVPFHDGVVRDVNGIYVPEADEQGQVKGFYAVLRDVTERRRAELALKQRNQELALLNQAGQIFNRSLDLDQVLVNVLDEVRRLMEVLACSIWLLDPATGELVCQQATGPKKEIPRGWRLAPGQGLAGWVAKHGESLIVADAQQDARYFGGVDKQTGIPLRSVAAVPLWAKNEVQGVLYAVDTEVDRFKPADLTFLESLAAAASIAIENARLYERARRELAERKRSEEKLRYQATLLENVSDAIISTDMDFTIQSWNKAAERIYGWPFEEVSGQPIAEIVKTAFPSSSRDKTIKQLLQKGYWQGEVVQQRKDAAKINILASVSLLKNSAGDPIGSVAVNHDITVLKQAEEALRASEANYRAIVEDQTELIARHKPDGTIVFVNEAYCRYFERPREQLIGTDFLTFLVEADQQALRDRIGRLTPLNPVETDEYREIRPDGSIRWLLWTDRGIFDENGHLVEIQAVGRDVTERRRAEEEIRKLNAELEQRVAKRTAELEAKNKELETFAYSVSHDLKAPLRGIDGYSRLLLEDHAGQLNGEARTFLHTIRQATIQMHQLIDDLLAYSRMERRHFTSGRVNPRALVEALIAERTSDFNNRHIELVVEVPCISVSADADGLAQALRNLIDNALKFTRDVPNPRLEIGCSDSEAVCTLWVRDNGIGFDMRYQERVFEIFQRLHRTEEYPGTGVGLAIVRKAVQRMGGQVWAESTPGEGTTFYLELGRCS